MTEQSLGEYRVGVSFNPSGNDQVDKIKKKAAELIDLIYIIAIESDDLDDPVRKEIREIEVERLKTLAMEYVELAAVCPDRADLIP